MAEANLDEESCETCRFLTREDTCGNPESVYHHRPMVYRAGDEVLQTGWCEYWSLSTEACKGS